MQSAGSASQRRLDVLTRHIATSSTASSNGTAPQQQQQSVLPTLQRQHTAGSNGGMFAGQVVVITGQ
jgi:flagellar basal body rod protein FlgC